MSLTKADLRDRIGRLMGIVQAGDTLGGYAAGRIDQTIEDVHALLTLEGIATWDIEEMPDHLAVHLRDYIAAHVEPSLMSREAALDIASMKIAARAELLRLTKASAPPKAVIETVLTRMAAPRRRWWWR